MTLNIIDISSSTLITNEDNVAINGNNSVVYLQIN